MSISLSQEPMNMLIYMAEGNLVANAIEVANWLTFFREIILDNLNGFNLVMYLLQMWKREAKVKVPE